VVKTNVPRPVRQWAIARVSKPRDRKFFFLAANSRERVLVSHDYNDFTNDNRAQAKRRFKVRICDAEGARSLL
jgi:hypothetical protein